MDLVYLLAAEEGGHANPLIPETTELVWGAISFFILFALLAKFAFPSLNKALAERSENIEGNLEKAEQERAQAQALLRDYEQKLQDAHAEAQRIVDQARVNADRLEVELRGKAEQEAARIVERARAAVSVERDRAINELRSEVGTLAIDLASKVIGESLDRQRHLALIDQYVADLQGAGSRGNGSN